MTGFVDPLVAEFQASGNKSNANIASILSQRFPLVLDDLGASGGLEPVDFIADAKICLIWNNKLWRRDDTDHTSSADNLTVVVSSDGVRFKTASVIGSGQLVWPVKGFITDPSDAGSVSIGDQYGLNNAPTGDFAGHGRAIATALAGSPSPIWAFTSPVDGLVSFDVARQTFRSYGAGNWTDGLLGSAPIGSVNPESLAVPRFIVQAQQSAPPGSPSSGQYFIVGTSATGAWSGHDNAIAKYTGSSWSFFAPSDGWKASDEATGTELTYSAGAWSSSGSAKITAYPARIGTSSTYALSGSSPGPATAPTNATGLLLFPEGSSTATQYTLGSSTNRLLLRIRLDFTGMAGSNEICIAVFIDSQVTCSIGNWRCDVMAGANQSPTYEFEVAPGDVSLHQYNIRVYGSGTIQRAYLQFVEVSS